MKKLIYIGIFLIVCQVVMAQTSTPTFTPTPTSPPRPPTYTPEPTWTPAGTPTFYMPPGRFVPQEAFEPGIIYYTGVHYLVTPAPTWTPTVAPGLPTNTPIPPTSTPTPVPPTITPTPAFLRRDGTTTLLGDWDAGNYEIGVDRIHLKCTPIAGTTTFSIWSCQDSEYNIVLRDNASARSLSSHKQIDISTYVTSDGGQSYAVNSNIYTTDDSLTQKVFGFHSFVETFSGASDEGYGFIYEVGCPSTGGTQYGYAALADYAGPVLDGYAAFYANGEQLSCSNKWGIYIDDLPNFFEDTVSIGVNDISFPLSIRANSSDELVNFYTQGTGSRVWWIKYSGTDLYLMRYSDPYVKFQSGTYTIETINGLKTGTLKCGSAQVTEMTTAGYVMNDASGNLTGGNALPTALPTPTPHNYWGTLYDDDADKLIPSVPDRELHIITDGAGHSDVYTATDDYVKITIYTPVPTYTPHSEVWSTATPTPSTQTGQQRFNTDWNIWETWNPTIGDWVPMRVCSAHFARNNTGSGQLLIYAGYLYYTARWEVSQDMLLYGLEVSVNNDLAAGQSYTITVKKNGTNTSLAATVSGDSTGNKGAGHGRYKYVSVTDGDNITVAITSVAGGASTSNKIAAQLLYIPLGL